MSLNSQFGPRMSGKSLPQTSPDTTRSCRTSGTTADHPCVLLLLLAQRCSIHRLGALRSPCWCRNGRHTACSKIVSRRCSPAREAQRSFPACGALESLASPLPPAPNTVPFLYFSLNEINEINERSPYSSHLIRFFRFFRTTGNSKPDFNRPTVRLLFPARNKAALLQYAQGSCNSGCALVPSA